MLEIRFDNGISDAPYKMSVFPCTNMCASIAVSSWFSFSFLFFLARLLDIVEPETVNAGGDSGQLVGGGDHGGVDQGLLIRVGHEPHLEGGLLGCKRIEE